ncbi:MAG TPA: DUF4080 domain-containing protein [Tepidisphaeraceae bacterium]|nr:DUF4080 domain-containing protein [Tepidisphaeraceae bacterium]
MPDIVLTTLNARYAHASFGLRYLMANLPPALRNRAAMLEFDIAQRSVDVLEAILAHAPKLVGVGVYIWNAEQSLRVVADLKRVRPDVLVVLGGPEVSYETDQQPIVGLADYVITGEADVAFGELCEKLLAGKRPLQKIIAAELPEFASKADMHPLLGLPYSLYTDTDLAHRVAYVEASRGCPFKCEFCLSSLDVPVRNVPLEPFLAAMQSLLDRGLRRFKFVDRTFNLNLNISRAILRFFLERHTPGLFLHFEMIPDRLPEPLRELIARFPSGALQFEVGVQTFNDDVAQRISRKQDNAKLADNLRFLREQTGVHVHADLIVGLPGETLASFGDGFDRLVAMRPQEIQVGMLKRLRGTPIVRHDAAFGMVYSRHAPYEILATRDIDFPTMQRMRRFVRYWDLIANSGNFVETTPLIWTIPQAVGELRESAAAGSPFHAFLALTDWVHATTGRQHGIALQELMQLLFTYLTDTLGHPSERIAPALWRDYQRGGRSDMPAFLRPHVTAPADTRSVRKSPVATTVPPRQRRHLMS